MGAIRILVVEDESIVGMEIRGRLEEMGYEVPAVVGTGEEAIRLADELEPHLVLTDVNLAGEIDGIDAAHRIRERHNVPIIYLTAYTDRDTLSRVAGLESFSYLIKPFHPRALQANIEIALYRASVEERLLESERKYRLLAENGSDVIFCTDLELRFTSMSPSSLRLLGIAPEETEGRSLRDLATAESFELASRMLKERLIEERATGEESRPIPLELELRRSDGSTLWAEVSFSFIRDADGRAMGILGAARDVTERTTLQRQLLVHQRTEAIGRLAGGIAHAYNNLMTTIMSHAHMVADEARLTTDQQASMRAILSSAERASALTRQLLAFGRKQALRPWIQDLNQTVQQAEEFLRQVLVENIHLKIRPQRGLGTVIVDGAQMEQVVVSLALNAAEAMPDGGDITIWTSNVELAEDTYSPEHKGVSPGSYVMLGVEDSGQGMDEETRLRLFEPFFTTKGVEEGRGMGLAASYGFVRQSGGQITVESTPGDGTTIRVYLPRVEATKTSHLRAPTGMLGAGTDMLSPVSDPGTATVLVVDDNEFVMTATSLALKRSGFQMLTANGPEEALRVASQHLGKIDVLLTDLVMPKMNGRQLAERMLRARPDIEVLYMSGYGTGVLGANMDDLSESRYIRKPFSPDELARKVRSLLSMRQAPASERGEEVDLPLLRRFMATQKAEVGE